MGTTSTARARLMEAALASMWGESYGAVSIEDRQVEGVLKSGDPREKADGAMAYLIGLVTQAKLHIDVEILRDLASRLAGDLRRRESAVA